MIDEKAIQLAARAACINAGHAPADWDGNEVMRARFLGYARSILQALSPGTTGEAEGWVLVPKDLAERAQHVLSTSEFPHNRRIAAEISALLSAAEEW